MSRLRAVTVAAVLASLAGCGAGHDFHDLQGYMDEVRARPKGRIEPIPSFQPYEAFTYSAANLRSPFQPPIPVDLARQQRGSKDIKPDENRVRQFLEGFNIEMFEMVQPSTSPPSRIQRPMPHPASRIAQFEKTTFLNSP